MLRRTALNYLTRRDHSQSELAQKLRGKKFPHDDIQAHIASLAQEGLLNDSRFAENYCRYRRAKGYGPLRISMELQARGINAETIAEVIQITDNAWFAEAERIWRKRFKSTAPKDLALRAKQMRFLQYRGFTREQIEHVARTRFL